MPAVKRVSFLPSSKKSLTALDENEDTTTETASSSPDDRKKEQRRFFQRFACVNIRNIVCDCFSGSSNQSLEQNDARMTMLNDDSDHAQSGGRPPFIPSLNGGNDGLGDDHSNPHRNSGGNLFTNLSRELMNSSELLFNNKLNWLLLLGPLALVGDATGFLGEAACFAFSGIALIPCAERCVQEMLFVLCARFVVLCSWLT